MNEVGKLPPPKAWCMSRVKATGLLELGYIHSKPWKKMRELEEKAVEVFKRIPANPGRPHYPALHAPGFVGGVKGLTTEQREENAQRMEKYKQHEKDFEEWWDANHASQREALDYLPIYDEVLTFTGHGRGRSSFTLQFRADDGQELEFGPGGSEDLVRSMLDGKSLIIGGKLRVRFTFRKTGSNLYAEVHYP